MGYTSTAITGLDNQSNVQWYQIGIQFEGVGGTTGEIKLGDAVKLADIEPTTVWRNRSSGPFLQVYNGRDYDLYYYCAPSASGLEKNAWVNTLKQDASDVILHLGDAFWFSAKSLGNNVGTLTVAGQVKLGSTATLDVDANTLQMGANPFPVAIAVKDIGCSLAATTVWRDRSKGTVLQIFNGRDYDLYYYCAPSASGLANTTWVNTLKQEATALLPAGAGFWLLTNGETGTLTFTMPTPAAE